MKTTEVGRMHMLESLDQGTILEKFAADVCSDLDDLLRENEALKKRLDAFVNAKSTSELRRFQHQWSKNGN